MTLTLVPAATVILPEPLPAAFESEKPGCAAKYLDPERGPILDIPRVSTGLSHHEPHRVDDPGGQDMAAWTDTIPDLAARWQHRNQVAA